MRWPKRTQAKPQYIHTHTHTNTHIQYTVAHTHMPRQTRLMSVNHFEHFSNNLWKFSTLPTDSSEVVSIFGTHFFGSLRCCVVCRFVSFHFVLWFHFEPFFVGFFCLGFPANKATGMHEVSFVLFVHYLWESLLWESNLKIIDGNAELQNAIICCHILS